MRFKSCRLVITGSCLSNSFSYTRQYFTKIFKQKDNLTVVLKLDSRIQRFLNIALFLVGPQLLLLSNRLIAEEKQNVTVTCTATGQPQPGITWSRAVGSLPKDRTDVRNGALTIYEVTKKTVGYTFVRQ